MTPTISQLPSGLFGLRSDYDAALVALCKAIPGLRWDTSSRLWVGGRDSLALLAHAAKLANIDIKHEDLTPADRDIKGMKWDPARPFLPLRPYQDQGAAFLYQYGREGVLLGDAMGLGKTLTAIAAMADLRKAIIVCPSYVRGVWRKELVKWAPERKVFFPEGIGKRVTAVPDDVDTIVIHYDILHAWASPILQWYPDVVCFDEAHMLQSEKSQRAIAARSIASVTPYKWGLTGTPLTNRPRDLWNVVDVLSPGRLGNFFQFGKRYCDAHQEEVAPGKVVWKFSGKSNLEELAGRTKYFMLRRTVSDVGLQLPPKTRQVVYFEKDKAAPSRITEVNGAEMRRHLDIAADNKLPRVWELLQGHLESGARVVCFTWRRKVAEWLAGQASLHGYPTECIHGGVTHAARGAALDRMAKGEGAALLCATIDSASVGVDFTFASVCVFAEIDYKPHALLQAEARLHRYGATSPVLIQYALASGTIDEVIANIVISKLDTFEEAIGTTGETLGADLLGNEEDILASLMAAIETSKGPHGK